jgi:hypothetical protein
LLKKWMGEVVDDLAILRTFVQHARASELVERREQRGLVERAHAGERIVRWSSEAC